MSLKYQFLCDNCGYKRFTDGSDIQDLTQYKTSPIPRGTPYIDPVTKKVINPKPIPRAKQFKCPGCGMLIKARKITLVEMPNEQTNKSDGCETGFEGQKIPGELT